MLTRKIQAKVHQWTTYFSSWMVAMLMVWSSSVWAIDAHDFAMPENEPIADFFSGTVSMKNNDIVFYRCSLDKSEYVVSFQDAQHERVIRELAQKKVKFWLSVIAVANTTGGQNYLKIKQIQSCHLNESCHLDDLFS